MKQNIQKILYFVIIFLLFIAQIFFLLFMALRSEKHYALQGAKAHLIHVFNEDILRKVSKDYSFDLYYANYSPECILQLKIKTISIEQTFDIIQLLYLLKQQSKELCKETLDVELKCQKDIIRVIFPPVEQIADTRTFET